MITTVGDWRLEGWTVHRASWAMGLTWRKCWLFALRLTDLSEYPLRGVGQKMFSQCVQCQQFLCKMNGEQWELKKQSKSGGTSCMHMEGRMRCHSGDGGKVWRFFSQTSRSTASDLLFRFLHLLSQISENSTTPLPPLPLDRCYSHFISSFCVFHFSIFPFACVLIISRRERADSEPFLTSESWSCALSLSVWCHTTCFLCSFHNSDSQCIQHAIKYAYPDRSFQSTLLHPFSAPSQRKKMFESKFSGHKLLRCDLPRYMQ